MDGLVTALKANNHGFMRVEVGARAADSPDAFLTTLSHGRLLLPVLGGLADFERELILIRTGEGWARGVKTGRKPKLTPRQRSEALARIEAGEAMRDIARSYNVAHTTISRLPKPY